DSPKKDELGPKVKTRDLVRILHGEGYSVPQITAALRINRTYGYALLKEYQPKKRERSDEAALRQKIQELCGVSDQRVPPNPGLAVQAASASCQPQARVPHHERVGVVNPFQRRNGE
ncbi:hypothetical protein, partial [Thermoactinomyces sp. CICC 10521]|uniref:hypothetical protein n=1 Tax=Thermoactinomyces sp. CICC 10521 TaxID=2767426 RepID=UPI00351C083E